MTGDRFYVVGLSGYTINVAAAATAGQAKPLTTYSVLDRDDCHREVFRVAPPHSNPDEKRKQVAERRCAELNAWARVQERVA